MSNEHGEWTSDGKGNTFYQYHLDLTDSEYETLRFLSHRGYDCGLMAASDGLFAMETGVRLTFREHAMWEVKATHEGSSGFTCASFALQNKLYTLLDAIV